MKDFAHIPRAGAEVLSSLETPCSGLLLGLRSEVWISILVRWTLCPKKGPSGAWCGHCRASLDVTSRADRVTSIRKVGLPRGPPGRLWTPAGAAWAARGEREGCSASWAALSTLPAPGWAGPWLGGGVRS